MTFSPVVELLAVQLHHNKMALMEDDKIRLHSPVLVAATDENWKWRERNVAAL